jgi:hypothetical protein
LFKTSPTQSSKIRTEPVNLFPYFQLSNSIKCNTFLLSNRFFLSCHIVKRTQRQRECRGEQLNVTPRHSPHCCECVLQVLLAEEKATGRKFAVKQLLKQHILKEKKAKYAITERDILSKCDHPNIIKLYYTFRDAQHLCTFTLLLLLSLLYTFLCGVPFSIPSLFCLFCLNVD